MQEAAAGGGASYAALYDRYSTQVYNYCLRLTGSEEDAADATQDAFVNVLARLHQDDRPVLDFASYLFAAARNESYALMRRRSRTHPTDDPPEPLVRAPDVETDPERSALLRDSQQAVRQANAQLAPRHREVLALREVAGRSYDEIGDVMGISENAAAQLIWRARSKLKVALTAGAVASVVATSEDCETAQILLNRLQDGESITDAEQLWLDDHLVDCGKCRAARGMLFDVAASYRMWAPVALLAGMKADVLAHAGAVVGADWTGAHLTGVHSTASHGVGRFAKRPRGSQAAAGTAVTTAVVAVVGVVVAGLGGETAKVTAAPVQPAAIHSSPRVIPRPAAVRPPAVRLARAPSRQHPAVRAAHAPAATPAAKPAPRVEPPKPPVKKRVIPRPTPKVQPPAPPTGPCTWPGHGNGPGGCPPGHGGVPPGQGGTPPGQQKRSFKKHA